MLILYMNKLLYTVGDSFTYGTELQSPENNSWPLVLANKLNFTLVNDAQPGASNDYMLRAITRFCKTNSPDVVIVAFTTPDRIELGYGKHLTPNSAPQVFKNWDPAWAYDKYMSQIELLSAYLDNTVPEYYFLTAWSVPLSNPHYIGRLVEFAYNAPIGPGGHPLEQGHQQIAEKIYEKMHN